MRDFCVVLILLGAAPSCAPKDVIPAAPDHPARPEAAGGEQVPARTDAQREPVQLGSHEHSAAGSNGAMHAEVATPADARAAQVEHSRANDVGHAAPAAETAAYE